MKKTVKPKHFLSVCGSMTNSDGECLMLIKCNKQTLLTMLYTRT